MSQELIYYLKTEMNEEQIVQRIEYPCEKNSGKSEYRELIITTAIEHRNLIEREPKGTSLEMKLITSKKNNK